MSKTLYLLRGCSGSGKTTLAKTLEASLPNSVSVSADDFWYNLGDGEYEFDLNRLGEAHDWCKRKVQYLMSNEQENIILHNTNTSGKEIKPYLKRAEFFNYKVVSLIIEKRHNNGNVHDVPEYVITNQEKRLRNNLKLV